MDRIATIHHLWEELVVIAPWWSGFCAPLAEEELRAFENAHDIQLPDDYRRLLLEVGDRAPIPGQARGGLLPLAGATSATTASALLGPLNESFTYTGDESATLPWNDERDDYCQVPPLRGLLPIGDGGCDVTYHLVVTGDDRGLVWIFAPSAEPELSPTNENLLTWYQRRLETGMAPLRRAHAAQEKLEDRLRLDAGDDAAAITLARELLLVDTDRASALIEGAWLSPAPASEELRAARLRAVAELDLLQGRYDRIVTMQEEDDAWLCCYAGIAAARSSRWEDAERLLGAGDFTPLSMRALAAMYRGRAMMELGQHQAALEHLRSSTVSAHSYGLLAKLYAARGDTDEARRAREKVRSANPRHPQSQPRRPQLADRLWPALP